MLKLSLVSAALFALAAPCLQAQTETISTPVAAVPETPKIQAAPAWYERPAAAPWFPRNWVRGYTDFSFAPPHNEPDLGRCSPSHAVIVSAGGASSTCNAYARYLWSGYLEVQPFGKTFLRHAFVFFTPTFSFGNNVPQFKYTASMAAIAYERSVGLGIELPKNFEFRVTQHQVDWLGKYNNNAGLGLADLHTSGPYGLYTTIGARWYFGGYGRSQ